MVKTQKILYLTISDLKELGLLKNKSKCGKCKNQKYTDAKGQVKSTYTAPSSSQVSYGLSSGLAMERSNNLLTSYDQSINDVNRFKILMANKISSINDIQDKDRLLNNDKFQQAENLYNNNVVPLINKVGSTVGRSGGSDTFTHTTNTAKRFQVNDAQPTVLRSDPNLEWRQEQLKINEQLDIQKQLDKSLQEAREQNEINEMNQHDKLVTPPKPTTLRGNKDVVVEDVEDEDEDESNDIVIEPEEEEKSDSTTEYKYNPIIPNYDQYAGKRKHDLSEFNSLYKHLIKWTNKHKKQGVSDKIPVLLTTKSDYEREIITMQKAKLKYLGSKQKFKANELNPNVFDKAIEEQKAFLKGNKPFEDL